ncbi:alpha/beta fold hydrolase [Nocardioides convexus]|uniref:alpha/beta fold hydrolase n=1 Tax=Nocardioides convexus TaxID=2712224 RepID=UPI0024189BB5|nr:alpha/beta fold hydrolase [Nocardioides convexus]
MIAVNPGGPGGSGLAYATLGGAIPNGVGAKFDWYGFDPRGVGRSTPSLRCDPDYPGAGYDRPNYVPTRAADLRWWRQTTSDYSRACAKADAKGLLPHLRTTDVARDLDSLRKAAGQEKAQLLRLLLRHLPRPGLRDPVPEAGRPVRVGRRAQRQERLLPGQPRPGHPVRQEPGHLLEVGRRPRRALRPRHRLARHQARLLPPAGANSTATRPPTAKLGPDELDDVMLSAGYYVYDWVALGDAYAKPGQDRRRQRRARQPTAGPETTTASRSTTACSARTRSGRAGSAPRPTRGASTSSTPS